MERGISECEKSSLNTYKEGVREAARGYETRDLKLAYLASTSIRLKLLLLRKVFTSSACDCPAFPQTHPFYSGENLTGCSSVWTPLPKNSDLFANIIAWT